MGEIPEYQRPGAVARFAVERAMAELVEGAEGPGGFVEVEAYRGAGYTRRVPRPLPALRAAVLVRNVAEGAAQNAIRGAGPRLRRGRSWPSRWAGTVRRRRTWSRSARMTAGRGTGGRM